MFTIGGNGFERLRSLYDEAYVIYKNLPIDICNKDAELEEVEFLLDRMLDFCGDDRILELFKQVCRKYYKTYPEAIAFQIRSYREYYDSDNEE